VKGPHTLTATPSGSSVGVLAADFAIGCCPTVVVGAIADPATCTIEADVQLVGDECDCAMPLDISWSMGAVPAGTWTVTDGGASTTVTVP
jgi:hypothetical protein